MDHEALATLLTSSGSGHKPQRLHRWSDRLYQYNFSVEYISGSANHVANMLSSIVHDSCSDPPMLNDAEVLGMNLAHLVTPEELQRVSQEDATLQRVCNYITNGWPRSVPTHLKPYFQLRAELTSFHQICVARGSCAVIPESLQARVLQLAHDHHPGIVRMKQRCREAVWCPGMNTHIEQFVHNCEACAISGKSVKPTQPPMQQIEWPPRPLDTAPDRYCWRIPHRTSHTAS